MAIKLQLRHIAMVVLLICFVLGQSFIRAYFTYYVYITGNTWSDWITEVLVDAIRVLVLMSGPLTLSSILGFVLFSLFPEAPKLQSSPLLAPFICFRVVTRGKYPELVQENVERNIKVIESVGIEKYILEVVSDESIHLKRTIKTKETVVPLKYSSKTGSMFKARALQYCLEAGVNMLNDDDWIVHLDEETHLTEESVIGILNFVCVGKSEFGQGVIMYARGCVVNWWMTLIDSVRVAFDYGSLRFCLKVLHKPIFNWKGSFVVANVGAERDVTYDHGPEGSIAEDCFFGAVAISKGYRFDFIEGHMCEQSPFSMFDYIKQRKRWFNGILLTALSPKIKLQHKFGIILLVWCVICMPVTTFGVILTSHYPMSFITCALYNTISAVYPYMFFLGALKSLSIQRLGLRNYIVLVLGAVVLIPLGLFLENTAVIWGILSHKTGSFDIVQKDYKKKKGAIYEIV